jgi:putative two-component system response regulator
MTANQEFRVLLVEDNPYDARIITRVLSRYPFADFDIHLAGSTQECLDQMHANPPEILLLDNGLPGESGMSFLGRMGLLPDTPPVIMLTSQGDERMALEAIRCGAYDYYPKDAISSDILGRAVHLTMERFRLDREVRRGNEQVIFALADAVEGKDSTTGGHLRRMQWYASRLGQSLGLDGHDLMILEYGAILHDIGKISVSEAVLCKQSSLTDTEWLEMKKHPLIGERICAPLRFADEICAIIRHHHERWDGGGYVDGLAGAEIPYLARLICVVDSFDAMTSDRPYRQALPLTEAISLLESGVGSQWDPDIVRPFLELLNRKSTHRLFPAESSPGNALDAA